MHRRMRISRSARMAAVMLLTGMILMGCGGLKEEVGFVRSYLLKDGRLYLSLMADGGIYAWEPDTDTAFLTTPDKVLEAAIPEAEPDYTRDVPWK